jgi:phage terminase Nu1 subunit (DNA packaging protein)
VTNEDLMNILLISSDPVISSLRKMYPRIENQMFDEALQLIVHSEENEEDCDDEEFDISESNIELK